MGYAKNLQYSTEYHSDYDDYDMWHGTDIKKDETPSHNEIENTWIEEDDSIFSFFGCVKCNYCGEVVKKDEYNYNARMCDECVERRKLSWE